jgi:hypothetical protein
MSNLDSSALLYSERPEWSDVTPLPQYEAFNPLAPIFYTEECLFLIQYISYGAEQEGRRQGRD